MMQTQQTSYDQAADNCAHYICNVLLDVKEKRRSIENGFVLLNEVQIKLENILFGSPPLTSNLIIEELINLCDAARDILRGDLS